VFTSNLNSQTTWLKVKLELEQHIRLEHALAQQCHKVGLHTILIGMMGTI